MDRLLNVRLDLTNRPENVLLVREALTGVAETVGLDGNDLSDIRTAVTEACNNVVLHAYAGDEGPLEVEVVLGDGALDVVVRDHGAGMPDGGPAGDAAEDLESGIGLPVIDALTSNVEFEATAGGGTEVLMTFAARGARALEPANGDGRATAAETPADPDSTAWLSVSPTALARAVVPRLICVLAARAQFSTDRISDTQLLADALVAHASGSLSGTHLNLAVTVEPRDLEVRVGPIVAGRAESLVLASDVEGLGRVLEKLADGHGVLTSAEHDTLTLTLRDRAPAS
jgi:serine/threonine-protein kinase RsbW